MATEPLQGKLDRLRQVISDMQSVLVAYSGGIDSTIVLKIAHEQLGARALGITAVSPTFPEIELNGARQMASEIGARHELVHTDQLKIPAFVQNDARRSRGRSARHHSRTRVGSSQSAGRGGLFKGGCTGACQAPGTLELE